MGQQAPAQHIQGGAAVADTASRFCECPIRRAFQACSDAFRFYADSRKQRLQSGEGDVLGWRFPQHHHHPKTYTHGQYNQLQGFSAIRGKMADVIPSPATAPSTALCSPSPHRRSLPTVPPAANDSNSGMAAVSHHQASTATASAGQLAKAAPFQLALTPPICTEPPDVARPSSAVLATAPQSVIPCRCAARDADLSGQMLLCVATETISPPSCSAGGGAQLDKIAALMLLCKAALGSPVQMVPVSPGKLFTIASSSMTGDMALLPPQMRPLAFTDVAHITAGSLLTAAGLLVTLLPPQVTAVAARADAQPAARALPSLKALLLHLGPLPKVQPAKSSPAPAAMAPSTATPGPTCRYAPERHHSSNASTLRAGKAATARQDKAVSASSGVAACAVRKQARSLNPEAPTRRQAQRAAKPQWH
ncbi:hypothetical protein ABBQ38_005067 [Trebouxia sp. C0009 RCD-2024]